MRHGFFKEHFLDDAGRPAGGVSTGRGFTIAWQNGPLGRGDERREPNGAFVEDVLEAVRDRIEFYQAAAGGRFACDENTVAVEALSLALQALDRRTRAREQRQVEGTHAP